MSNVCHLACFVAAVLDFCTPFASVSQNLSKTEQSLLPDPVFFQAIAAKDVSATI